MVDCGATALFISERFVKEKYICMHSLVCEIPLYNINGSKNCAGRITHFAQLWLQVRESIEWCKLLVTELGPKYVVLGLPWLRSVNPEIDWTKGMMKIDPKAESGR